MNEQTREKKETKVLIKKKLILLLIPFMILLFSIPVSAAVNLDRVSISVPVGKTNMININRSKGVKWSRSNKKISIKAGSDYCIVKGVKTGTSYVKAKVKGKTYKCKVKVLKKFNAKTVKKKVTVKSLESEAYVDEEKAEIYKIHNDSIYDVSVKGQITYYDKNGNVLGVGNINIDNLLPGRDYIRYDLIKDYSKKKISYSVDYADEYSFTFFDYNKIKIAKNKSGDSLYFTVKNNSKSNVYCSSIIALFYDENEKIIDFGLPLESIEYSTIRKGKSATDFFISNITTGILVNTSKSHTVNVKYILMK